MTKHLLVAAALAACTTPHKTTPLAELSQSQIEIVARGQINIELHIDESAGCPTLDDRLVARFDGSPMQVSRGGYDTNSSGCWPIAFWFDALPQATVAAFETGAAGSELVIADPSATWTIDTSKLFGDDFFNDTANSRIIWADVATITSAIVLPGGATTIQGNIIHYPPGTAINYVDAIAHPVATRCDGPGLCTVNLEGTHTWGVQP